MSPERWQQVQSIFFTAEETPAEERDAFLSQACGDDADLRRRVVALLDAAGDSGDFLERAVGEAAGGLVARSEPVPAPGQVGAYELIRKIGDGGMGAVYLARRADEQFHKQVAVKMIRAGFDSPDLRNRFRIERQILARLEHPHIARMLDGGTTPDGRPYVVMEYVDGEPLNEFLRNHPGTPAERLRLFLDICSAVEYAHRNLVVHRDIKPGNILVTEDGHAKLLDFGIAKLISPDAGPAAAEVTRTAERMMTPEYASPEQIRGEPVTTATDVYSLGVLLYILLCGRAPFAAGNDTPGTLEKRICEEDPPPPRTGSSDLDAILAMAMRKEPATRYGSVAQLADDVRAHLGGFPVFARKGAWTYTLTKFVRRHRAAVAAATLFLLLLTAFAVSMTVQAGRIRRERDRAEKERRDAQHVASYLGSLFESLNTNQGRSGATTAREMLDRAEGSLDGELKDQPEVRAELLDIMGRAYESLGVYAMSERAFTRGLAIRRQLGDGLKLAGTLKNLAETQRLLSRFPEAEAAARESLSIRQRLLGEDHADIAESANTLGLVLWFRGDPSRAEPLFREALRIRQKLQGGDSLDAAVHMSNLAGVLRAENDLEGAEQMYRRVIALRKAKLGEEHPRTAMAMNGLGGVLTSRGKLPEAESLLRRTLELRVRLLGEGHPDVVTTRFDLATALHAARRLAEAEALYRNTLAAQLAMPRGEETRGTASSLDGLGRVLVDQGRLDEGEPLIRKSLDIRRRVLGERSAPCAQSLHDLARVLLLRGKRSEAGEALREAVDIRREKLGEKHPDTAESVKLLAEISRR